MDASKAKKEASAKKLAIDMSVIRHGFILCLFVQVKSYDRQTFKWVYG